MAEVGRDKEISGELKQLDISLNRLDGSIDNLETSVIDVLLPNPEGPHTAPGDEAAPMTQLGRMIRGSRSRVDTAAEHIDTINERVQI